MLLSSITKCTQFLMAIETCTFTTFANTIKNEHGCEIYPILTSFIFTPVANTILLALGLGVELHLLYARQTYSNSCLLYAISASISTLISSCSCWL